jgi:hypothetical protein
MTAWASSEPRATRAIELPAAAFFGNPASKIAETLDTSCPTEKFQFHFLSS